MGVAQYIIGHNAKPNIVGTEMEIGQVDFKIIHILIWTRLACHLSYYIPSSVASFPRNASSPIRN